MYVAIIRFELAIPHATNLKEKRRLVNSILQRCRSRFGAAVAEVGDQDLWQRAVLGMALVSGEDSHVRALAHKLVAHVESHFGGEVCRAEVEIV